MSGADVAKTWADIYRILKSEFPPPNWTWDTERLENIATKLTTEVVKQHQPGTVTVNPAPTVPVSPSGDRYCSCGCGYKYIAGECADEAKLGTCR
jgi:hypothetical protein